MKLSSFNRVTNNLSKMGYYPTDLRDAKAIGTYLSGGYNHIILDPCCGKGEALWEIRRQISSYGETFGIEIEEGRAEKAKELLNMVINEDFFNLHIESGSFGGVFLNPPYLSNEQLHYPFIEKSTSLLAKKGIFILIIPEYELHGKTAAFLASHYEDIKIFRSNDKTFQQIIFFGKKKQKIELSEGHQIILEFQDAKPIEPNMDFNYCSIYKIPYTKPLQDIKILHKGIDPKKLQEQLDNFDEDWKKLISMIPEPSNVKRPLLPLRKGHLAQILASGMIDGVIEHPETRGKYLIKGTTTRTEEILEENDEETKLITRDVVTIFMMDQKGAIEQIR